MDSGLGIIQPQSIFYDQQNMWVVNANNVYELTGLAAFPGFLSKQLYANGFVFGSAAATRPATVDACGNVQPGNVFVGDDTSGGIQTNQGRGWMMSYE